MGKTLKTNVASDISKILIDELGDKLPLQESCKDLEKLYKDELKVIRAEHKLEKMASKKQIEEKGIFKKIFEIADDLKDWTQEKKSINDYIRKGDFRGFCEYYKDHILKQNIFSQIQSALEEKLESLNIIDVDKVNVDYINRMMKVYGIPNIDKDTDCDNLPKENKVNYCEKVSVYGYVSAGILLIINKIRIVYLKY